MIYCGLFCADFWLTTLTNAAAACCLTHLPPATCHMPPATCHLPRPVICPELIREVESRMNRDYLPPTLKSLSQSPPNAPTFGLPVGVVVAQSHPHSLPLSVVASVGGSNSVPLVVAPPPQTAANNRRAYRATHCKLPTVQEGGKFPLTDLLARTIIIIISPIFASYTTCTNLIISLSLCISLSLSRCRLATIGRYSPVRRASEGSRSQFQGPLQECQSLQKGIAQRNFLVAPSPPLLENSISLPGKLNEMNWMQCTCKEAHTLLCSLS